MTLDRESIERKDFPVGRPGYDPAAVDAHLSALADEVDELMRTSQHPHAETLAGAVSEQVRGIVEAAESSAAEILRGAELEAQEIRAQASQATAQATGEAQRTAAQAREYVGRLSSSISALLGRLEAIDGELGALTASLRGDSERLRTELTALENELEAAADVSEPMPAPVAAPEPPEPGASFASEPPPSEDAESARLIALNMALNGTPREETERYLAENYDLADRQRLLDEVYASVQG